MTQPSKFEVGVTSDDNNDTRLPGSVQPEPTMSPSSDFAQAGPLYTADTIVIGQPTVDSYTDFPSLAKGAGSVTGPTGLVETTASTENLSAKYKYPKVSQDVPKYGDPKTEFEDHN